MKNKILRVQKFDSLHLPDDHHRMLIVSDLDGTLLNNNSELSHKTIETVKKIVAQGHLFCIATGRPLRASIDFYNQLGLDTIIVNYNGSRLCNPSDPSFDPITLSFSHKLAADIIINKNIYKYAHNILVENNDGVYIVRKPETKEEEQVFKTHFHVKTSDQWVKYLEPDCSNIKSDVHSILILVKDDKKINEITLAIKKLSNTLIVRNWPFGDQGIIIEINGIFASKGTALKYLSSYYGIPLENTMAFGDGDNDNTLLREAFFGFAMLNGGMTAKLSARYITEKINDDDGVANELTKFFIE